MTDWFDRLYITHKRFMDAARECDFERGVWQTSVEKYADPVHFVYELLQNAEDQAATMASFHLSAGRLIFEHDGKPFTRKDVENITGLGNTEKPEQRNKIGRFGIGFKSVFVITDAPKIYTTLEGCPFSFAIHDLVVPERIECVPGTTDKRTTRFVLDFKPSRSLELGSAIQSKLRSLGEDTLLFLRNLTSIQWQTPSENGVYLCDRSGTSGICHLTGESGHVNEPKHSEESAYIAFSKTVHLVQADRLLDVQIAFRVDGGSVVPERSPGIANVYFPTREKTGLKFRLHAPFLLNDSRENLKDDCPENKLLIQACAELLAETMPKLRDMGYMTVECLECLPIREQDFNDSAFAPMFDATRKALRTQALLPASSSSTIRFVQSCNAKISEATPLKNLLGQKQLTDLYGTSDNAPVCWLADKIQRNANSDLWSYLIRHLEVDDVDSMKFARKVSEQFLSDQSDQWIIDFYGFLNEQTALWRAKSGTRDVGPLRYKPIIRVETPENQIRHLAPFAENGALKTYLPTSSATGFETVKRSITANEDALRFLQLLGLKTPEVVDNVLRFILPRYRVAAFEITPTDYASELSTIADAIQTARHNELNELAADLLKTPFILAANAADGKQSHKRPDRVYLNTSDIVTWFSGNSNAWIINEAVTGHTNWSTILAFLRQYGMLLESPKVTHEIEDFEGHVSITRRHGWHSRGLSGFDPKADIDGLSHALRNKNIERSRILWRILLKHTHLIKGVVESSTQQFYINSQRSETYSILGEKCSQGDWLPDRSGAFHAASALRLSQLPSNFDVSHQNCTELATKLGMSNPEEQAVADNLGIPADVLVAFAYAYRTNPDIMDQIKARQTSADFPSADGQYTDRRADKVAAEARAALEKEYEQRQRSVRTSDSKIIEEAKQFLRGLYTDNDGNLRCQICTDIMPFKDKYGDHFFFAIQFIKDIRKELIQNYLALCPLCAAKYRYARTTPYSDLEILVMSDPIELALGLELAQLPHELHFHEFHIKDVRHALKSLPGG